MYYIDESYNQTSWLLSEKLNADDEDMRRAEVLLDETQWSSTKVLEKRTREEGWAHF